MEKHHEKKAAYVAGGGMQQVKLYLKPFGVDEHARFAVLDELGHAKCTVLGEFTAAGGNLYILDEAGTTLAHIKQRNILFVTRYLITAGGENISLIQSMNASRPFTRLTGVVWQLRGDLQTRNFDVIDVDHSVVMTHGKRWTQWGDCYEITVTAPENELLCTCIAVCIDNTVIIGGEKTVAVN